MGYAPLDDRLNANAKILSLTHEEFRLWVAGLVWVYGEKEPGDYVIPPQVARSLAASHGVKPRAIPGLLAKGLWETAPGGGYEPHNAAEHDKRSL